MVLINFIKIEISSLISFFIKNEKLNYLLMKCLLKSISRNVIKILYLFNLNSRSNFFKKNLLIIFIKYLIFKHLDFNDVFIIRFINLVR